jgi:hypothetical protein
MSRRVFIFHSALAPDVVADALRRTTDKERWTLFSLSGFRGDRSLLAEVGQQMFRLRKRLSFRNDFAGQFYARFEPERAGTRIEGYFDSPPWTRIFIRVWLAGAVFLGIPILVMAQMALATGTQDLSENSVVGLIVPLALIALGFLLPRIGRLLSKGDERFILEYVQNTLVSRIEESKAESEELGAHR